MKAFSTLAVLLSLVICSAPAARAEASVVEYDLTLAWQRVNLTGFPAGAMTINGGIPGPVLRFQEGDLARIRVHNKMDVETSIHWHGILVPPGMDGVPFISFLPIAAGTTFTYEFPIRQNGTYWYHSHTSLQEQRGVYGAIVIEPRDEVPRTDREHVLVLSDWTDEDPNEVLRTLKRGSEWNALAKGGAQSILGAARTGMLGNYVKRELQRMPPMDIADVSYDRFLVNGAPSGHIDGAAGETVRLRIVDGSATTFFHLEFAGGPMTIVAADGQEVEPFDERRFLIGVAETYDVLIRVPDEGAWEFRATSHDASAFASVWIGSGEQHPAPVVPKPNLYHAMGELSLARIFALTPAASMGMGDTMVEKGMFDKPGMMGGMMDGMMHPMGGGMGHSMGHDTVNGGHADEGMHHRAGDKRGGMHGETVEMPASNAARHPQLPPSGKRHAGDFSLLGPDIATGGRLVMDGMSPERPWVPYDKLRSPEPTAFPADKPRRDVRLTLDGDMERYVWFLNNRPLSESDVIPIRKGEIVRFIMINRTMMHHPMHLHGHFFRVINEQGDHAPLKHTVDVAPMSTTVIEFDAEEFGDWFFHCHLLYHMKAGMARVVHYEGFDPGPTVAGIRSQLYREHWYGWTDADVMSNMTLGTAILSDTRNILSLDWEVGWEGVKETETEVIASWDRYVNRFLGVFAGADVLWEGDEPEDVRGIVGLRYLLPFNLESTFWMDTDSGARILLEKTFHLTPRLALSGDVQYDTHDLWEGHAGIHYTVSKRLALMAGWHSEYGWGGGLGIGF